MWLVDGPLYAFRIVSSTKWRVMGRRSALRGGGWAAGSVPATGELRTSAFLAKIQIQIRYPNPTPNPGLPSRSKFKSNKRSVQHQHHGPLPLPAPTPLPLSRVIVLFQLCISTSTSFQLLASFQLPVFCFQLLCFQLFASSFLLPVSKAIKVN